MYGYSDSSTANVSSRFSRAKSCTRPLWTQSHRPYRNGWQLVCWTAVPVEARMCARKSGDSTWPATSRRLRSFQAGSMLRNIAGVSVFASYQPTPPCPDHGSRHRPTGTRGARANHVQALVGGAQSRPPGLGHLLRAVGSGLDHEPFGVHEDVALGVPHLLGAVEAALLPAQPGGLCRLVVHHPRTRFRIVAKVLP